MAVFITDMELVEKSILNDVDAFEELVRRYQNKIFTIAYRMLGSREDAADFAQEAFVKAFRALPQFRGDASFQTWLYHIITNVCRDELRRRVSRSAVSLDKEVIIDQALGPQELLENKEIGEAIQNAINLLGPEYRLTLIMREIQGLSYEEIANKLNCSVGTVKSRLNRARTNMKNILFNSMEHSPIDLRQDKVKEGV